MSHVQRLLALTSSSCLMGSNSSNQAAVLLAYITREEKSVARLGSRILSLNFLGLQNRRKSLSLRALVGLWPLRCGPHHGYMA